MLRALESVKHGGNSEVGGRGIWGCVQGKMVALAETIAWIKGERFFSAKQKSVEKLW